MHLVVMLVCVAFTGYARRERTKGTDLDVNCGANSKQLCKAHQHFTESRQPLNSFVAFLREVNPAAVFNPFGLGVRLPVFKPTEATLDSKVSIRLERIAKTARTPPKKEDKRNAVWRLLTAAWCLLSAVWSLFSAVWVLLFALRCLGSGAWCLCSGVWGFLASIWYLFSGLWCLISEAITGRDTIKVSHRVVRRSLDETADDIKCWDDELNGEMNYWDPSELS